jgi:hypothetical protein
MLLGATRLPTLPPRPSHLRPDRLPFRRSRGVRRAARPPLFPRKRANSRHLALPHPRRCCERRRSRRHPQAPAQSRMLTPSEERTRSQITTLSPPTRVDLQTLQILTRYVDLLQHRLSSPFENLEPFG